MGRVFSAISLLIITTPLVAQEPPRYETRQQHDPNGIGKFYMDREIAMVMGHQAAGWLERPEREKEEQPSKLIEELKLKPGDAVADIGAGSGYYSFKFSQLVGEKGKIYAVDIQKEMLDIIRKKMKARNITNVVPHMGETKDPKLPDAEIDVIVMIDVYHEFDFPYEMMQAMIKSLKPGGRMVFVEFRMEDEKVPIKLVHKMSEQQVLKEMSVFPQMKHARTSDVMPWQHIIVFEKKADEKPNK